MPRRFLGLEKWSWLIVGSAAAFLAAVGLFLENSRLRAESGGQVGLFTRPTSAGRRLHRISLEVGSLGPGHPWAGVYSQSDGLCGTSIALTPRSGYVQTDWGDSGPWLEQEDGRVREENGVIFLKGSRDSRYRHGMRIVRWGGRRYLLAREQLEDFANDVNLGFETGYNERGSYLMSNGDDEAPVAGLPELPEESRRLLRATPLDAVVKALGVNGDVLIDVGRRQGALPGLKLEPRDPKNFGEFTIIRVSETTSVASFKAVLAQTPAPHISWRLSTRWEWTRSWSPAQPALEVSTQALSRVQSAPVPGPVSSLSGQAALTAARRAGFTVRPVARVYVRAIAPGLLRYPRAERLIDSALRASGANAILSPYEPRPRRRPGVWPFVRTVAGYRVDWKGQPLDARDFPFRSSRATDWQQAKTEIALNRSKFSRDWYELRYATVQRLFHLDRAEFDRLDDLRIEFLTPEQREALSSKIDGREFGSLRPRQWDSKADAAWWDALRTAESPGVEALKKSEPLAYAEFLALRKAAGRGAKN